MQIQLFNQVVQHLTNLGKLLMARQLDRVHVLGRQTQMLISHLSMKISGQFQHGIAERVGVVHTEQGHLLVG